MALYQPDIPGNTGTLLRLSACLDIRLHIIQPAGFRTDDRALRRSGMDYAELAAFESHDSWERFGQWRAGNGNRLILLTTKAKVSYLDVSYQKNDLLLLGRESSGVPEAVRGACDLEATIPMKAGRRSINMALCASMVVGEALRQTREKWPRICSVQSSPHLPGVAPSCP